jgi:SAM-dependent methyltransferase
MCGWWCRSLRHGIAEWDGRQHTCAVHLGDLPEHRRWDGLVPVFDNGCVSSGFGGDVATYYAKYRRGYPSAVVHALVGALGLSSADTVIDLGCGSGQLTLPLAGRVARVIGVDPEPDMLRHARIAESEGPANIVEWIVGTVDDLPEISAQYGLVGAITVANAIHLVDRGPLFTTAQTALRPGGGLAIIANGTPLWLQDTAWSRALRTFLEGWLQTELTNYCGTDDATRSVYQHELMALGYHTEELRLAYTDTLTLDQIVGGVFSAMSQRLPAPNDRNRFSSDLGRALIGAAPYTEYVSVCTLIAHLG